MSIKIFNLAPMLLIAKKILPHPLIEALRNYRQQKRARLLVKSVNKNVLAYDWTEFHYKILSNNSLPIIIHQKLIPWFSSLYQRPQHMASAFAKVGCLSIYVTSEVSHGFIKLKPNLWLAAPGDAEKIEGAYRIFYSTAENLKHNVEKCPSNSKFIYEYVDHIDAKIVGSQKRLENLKAGYDFALSMPFYKVLASSKHLYQELEQGQKLRSEDLLLIPNGVNVEDFEKSHYSPQKELEETFHKFRSQYKILVGYHGALGKWLDYDLINSVVSHRKDVGFVFIGPDYLGGACKLEEAENLLMLGAVEYKDLPYFSSQFDVAWIPFERGEIAKATSPLKLFEYFAMQKPVIVTQDLIECRMFEEVIVICGFEDIDKTLERALSCSKKESYRARLAAIARKNDWEVRAKCYLERII